MKKLIVSERGRLRDFTDEHYAQGSFAFSRLLREKDVRVNGKKTGENVMLEAGDEVAYYTTLKEEARSPPARSIPSPSLPKGICMGPWPSPR